MTPKRGDRAAPPPTKDEFDIRFANGEAATGWEDLSRQAPGNLRRAYDRLRTAPRSSDQPARHHRLKGRLGTGELKGTPLERWQYEVTAGGRLWYLIDDARRTVWLTYVGAGHPKATE